MTYHGIDTDLFETLEEWLLFRWLISARIRGNEFLRNQDYLGYMKMLCEIA